MNLDDYGWDSFFDTSFQACKSRDCTAGRVVAEYKSEYTLVTERGELPGEITGRMRFRATNKSDFPAVGDWVVIKDLPGEQRAIINGVLPRKSKFSRKEAGFGLDEQVIAANVDTVFVVLSLNKDFNLRKLERFLTAAWESGASPVVVLSKADLCDDVPSRVREVQSIAVRVPVHAISCTENWGLEVLAPYLKTGLTVTLMGSSGVGKSTLINGLMGQQVQLTSGVREDDDRGRHTTTQRQLLLLPTGGLLIDTPGMRELQLWHVDDGLDTTFDDIESLAKACKFKDCLHRGEPGCAVTAAIQSGLLDPDRLKSYTKMRREQAHINKKITDKERELARLAGKKYGRFTR